MSEHIDDLELKELGAFTGTESYHSAKPFPEKLTDGVAYVMQNGYTWLITDALSLIHTKPSCRGQEFYSIKLRLKKMPKVEAILLISDGNENILATQDYEFTTAKKELDLFLTDNVLMLSSEY